jgi:hypothetical protein
MRDAIESLRHDAAHWAQVSARCRAYMTREYDMDSILAPYADAVRSLAAAR